MEESGASRPVGYPVQCEAEILLTDGRRAHLRPVVPQDEADLTMAISHADPDTLRRRFLGGAPPSSPQLLKRLVTVDYKHRFALVALDDRGTGIGIARYEGERTWPTVEIALAVDPAWRGVGLGRELAKRVVQRATEQGAERLTADFYDDNVQVLGLLAEAHLLENRTLAHGVVADEVQLDSQAVARWVGPEG